MSNISYIGSPQTGISAVIRGQAYTVTADNPHMLDIWRAIMADASEESLIALFDMAAAIKAFSRGNIEIHNEQLFYRGMPIHNVVVDRIFAFMHDNLPVDPLLAFMERLMLNPSKRAVQELYTFLENQHLPITSDGHFLAYKGVDDNYRDTFSGKFENRPGAKHEMPRNMADDNFGLNCSDGFHVGSLGYSTHFGTKTVIVKVDPADVVSVPQDESCDKLRCCKYEVRCDYEGPLKRPLHSSERPYEPEPDTDEDFLAAEERARDAARLEEEQRDYDVGDLV